DFSAFEAITAGGLDALPAGEVVLGFVDPGSVGTIPRKWFLNSQMPYTVDVWRSADGVSWTQQSEDFWDGLAECQDAFAVAVAPESLLSGRIDPTWVQH
ncbi:KLHL4, partial [Symbiodinium necroappetens]